MPWRRNLQNEVFDRLSTAGVGVVSIRGEHPLADREERETDPALRARCPALRVSADKWKAVVAGLIIRADCIICEVWSDTPGISDELIMLRESGRTDDTLVLLPRPGVQTLRNYDTFNAFWRLVLYQDLDRYDLFDHPCMQGLGSGCLDRALSNQTRTAISPREAAADRGGVPVIFPDLVEIAERYATTSQDWGAAGVHAQNAWNIAVRLAAAKVWVPLSESEAIVRAAVILAYRLSQFERWNDAIAKLDVALILTSGVEELQQYRGELERIRVRYLQLSRSSSL